MFNNPFSSFHNMVAEAKEEREQLDRLLTISTPRERLVVGAVGVLLLGLAAWLFFGNVARDLAVDGVLVTPDQASAGESRSLQALVRVEGGTAPQVRAGMPATILFTGAGGHAATLDGEVTRISKVALSEELAALGTAPVSVYRVDVTLEEKLDAASLASQECRIVIELGRQSPAELLGIRRS